MKSAKTVPASIPEYIAGFPPNVRVPLKKIRAVIKKAAPRALESISYRIPTFKLNGRALIYFAAFKNHIGLYPITADIKSRFKKELSAYKGSTGTVRLPLDAPIPLDLIAKLVKFKLKQSSMRSKRKTR